MESYENLKDMLRDQFSPHALAAIYIYLQPATISDESVNREIRWFALHLEEIIGSPEEMKNLAEEIGL